MNQPTLTFRLLAAVAAVAITLLLVDAMVSIAAPERSLLMAHERCLDAPTASSPPPFEARTWEAPALHAAVQAPRQSSSRDAV